MAAVETLLNVGKCTQSGFNGTSNDFCPLDIKRIKKLLRTSPGFKFPEGFEFTLDNLLLEEQKGNIIPLYTLEDNTFTTAENGVQTFGGGVKSLIEKMPIEMQAKLVNGVQGYQNTLTVEKAKVHGFFIVDVDDTVFGQKTKDGLFGAITSPFFQVMPYTGAGDESAGYMIEWQLDRNQFDNRLVGLRDEDYDADMENVKGANNLVIDIPTAPVVGDTAVNFTVHRLEDKVAQLGLDNSEIEVSVNGTAEVSPTITDNGDGSYSVAVSALSLADEVSIRLYDGTYTIVNLDGVLLKGNTADTITVSA